jgi:hypothetical protein
MFFSPLHTPQNWQIASKRREIYQWAFLPGSSVMTPNGKMIPMEKSIANHKTEILDTLTGGVIYEDFKSDKILNSRGIFSNPVRFSKRLAKDKFCFNIGTNYYWRTLSCTEEHKILVLESIVDNDKFSYNINKKNISYVNIGDYLIFPIPKCGSDILDNKELNGIKETLVNLLIQKNVVSHEAVSFFEKDTDTNQWIFSSSIFDVNREQRFDILKHVFTDVNGNFLDRIETNNQTLSDQIFLLLLSCGIYASCRIKNNNDKEYSFLHGESKVTEKKLLQTFDNDTIYIINIDVNLFKPTRSFSSIPSILKDQCIFIDSHEIVFADDSTMIDNEESYPLYYCMPISIINSFFYSGKCYDIEIPPTYALSVNGYAASNCRFYYENEPRVAAGVDFYSEFPMNGFEIECRDQTILEFYKELIEDLDLMDW